MKVKNMTIVGGGRIGRRVAIRCAKNGIRVAICETEGGIESSQRLTAEDLQKAIGKNKMKPEQRSAILDNITWMSDLYGALRETNLVIEAVYEDETLKRETCDAIRTRLNGSAVPVLTVTSACPINATGFDAGFHPMTPPHINAGVEIIYHDDTPDDLVENLREFALACGWVPFIMKEKQSGFCVNGIFVPYLLEACRMLDEGFTSAEIEEAGKRATQFGMGPFALMNLTGIPITAHAAVPMQKQLGDWVIVAESLQQQVESAQDWVISGLKDGINIEKLTQRFQGVIFANALRVASAMGGGMHNVDRACKVCLKWDQGPGEMMRGLGRDRVCELIGSWVAANPSYPLVEIPEYFPTAFTPSDFIVRYDDDTHIAEVEVNRPEAMNALNRSMIEQLRRIDGDLWDRECRVAILTGAGRAFIAGADIAAMKDMTPDECRDYTQLGIDTLNELESDGIVWIAAVNGPALGGGLETAMACHVILMADNAICGLPERKLGVIPGFDGVKRALRRCGYTGAMTILSRPNHFFNAEEAFDLGLVNEVVPAAQLLERAREYARSLATECGPLAVKEQIQLLLAGEAGDAKKSEVRMFETADMREGMKAFLEKRKPAFRGE